MHSLSSFVQFDAVRQNCCKLYFIFDIFFSMSKCKNMCTYLQSSKEIQLLQIP